MALEVPHLYKDKNKYVLMQILIVFLETLNSAPLLRRKYLSNNSLWTNLDLEQKLKNYKDFLKERGI